VAGTLYIVGTPIGNLEDITLRALRTLREASLIACEDTRQTLKLLTHFDIRKPLVSCHEHNERERAAELVERLRAGENIALVTDAGMPSISDPGYHVVRAAIEAGVTVAPIPGATAIEAALAASGLPAARFRFQGFLPPKRNQRRKALEDLAEEPATLVFYESPRRIVQTLDDIGAVLGQRPVVVAREMTKIHEEFLRGTALEVSRELAAREAVKGEITLLVGGLDERPVQPPEAVVQRVAELLAAGVPRMDAIKRAARESGLSKREAYRLVEENGG
jgi:16S rRNA (cytidine1402-2'-O)-methyltransferase